MWCVFYGVWCLVCGVRCVVMACGVYCMVCCVVCGLADGSFVRGITHIYRKTNQMPQCIKYVLFWNDTLHISDGLSVHHQQFKTVRTATGICLLASKQSVEYCLCDACTVLNYL